MPRDLIHFDIWGCRGSRSYLPPRSRIGNNTSCYSVLDGEDLMVLDAGWGLPALGYAMEKKRRFKRVRRVHLMVSHAHCDHWEGIKDVGWLWERGNGLELTLWGSAQALGAIQAGFAHPSYVPMEILSRETLSSLRLQALEPHQEVSLGRWSLKTFPLNHASGAGHELRKLDTLGYRLTCEGGAPVVSYLLDHEPTSATRAMEDDATRGAHLVVVDAHFARLRDQRYGHGSQEHAVGVARRHPDTLVVAGHHGPMYDDAHLRRNFRASAVGVRNVRLAVEGDGYVWRPRAAAFSPVAP